ncbi:hypothetical protein LINPERHAP1_LOCUS22101 [Linum perenne]
MLDFLLFTIRVRYDRWQPQEEDVKRITRFNQSSNM